jgi:hypothetical protein
MWPHSSIAISIPAPLRVSLGVVALAATTWCLWHGFLALSLAPALATLYLLESLYLGHLQSQPFQPLHHSYSPKPDPSRVHSEYLAMQMDLDSGAISGRVLKGSFATFELAHLSHEQLISLWRELCREDSDGRVMLEVFLERTQPNWREAAGAAQEYEGGPMSRKLALEILGLTESASKAEIHAAWRKAIGQHHPDKGGSHRLAAMINEAKATLLG